MARSHELPGRSLEPDSNVRSRRMTIARKGTETGLQPGTHHFFPKIVGQAIVFQSPVRRPFLPALLRFFNGVHSSGTILPSAVKQLCVRKLAKPTFGWPLVADR